MHGRSRCVTLGGVIMEIVTAFRCGLTVIAVYEMAAVVVSLDRWAICHPARRPLDSMRLSPTSPLALSALMAIETGGRLACCHQHSPPNAVGVNRCGRRRATNWRGIAREGVPSPVPLGACSADSPRGSPQAAGNPASSGAPPVSARGGFPSS